jgi:hypothetical protein
MTILFNYEVKHLKSDDRGYATSLYCEMNGIKEGVKKIASTVFCFGGDDYKPMGQWTEQDIDNWAQNARLQLEENITAQFKQAH